MRGVLDRLAQRDNADLVSDFAIPVPLTVIGEIMGMPGHLVPVFHARLPLLSGSVQPDHPAIHRALRELVVLVGPYDRCHGA